MPGQTDGTKAGTVSDFSIPIPDLTAALIALVRQIPRGRVTTYGELALALGDRHAARWIAKVLIDPPDAIRSRAHRVVKLTGEPNRFPADALDRLVREKVPIAAGSLIDTDGRFREFVTDHPLARLKAEQERIAARVRLAKLRSLPKTVAALDISYRSDGIGVGAYVLMKSGHAEPLWTMTIDRPIAFPYIPGYLSFRELPIHAELLRLAARANAAAPMLLVDGAGTLHPRRVGVASQLGVLADRPTIGVTKHRLCGSLVLNGAFGTGTGCVVDDGETIAAALPPGGRGSKPIYVSPGHRCTLKDAVAIVTGWRRGSRLLEPIRIADALSRSVARAGLEAG